MDNSHLQMSGSIVVDYAPALGHGVGMNNAPKQNWSIGQVVKVGFMQLRVISGKIATPGNGFPDEYALENIKGDKFYRFTPHNGCYRCDSRQDALLGAANY